ncbi:MAG: hypothetical protein PF501_00400 [Salinisphaera sp.]|nr:hypothetical protein [Salinisphaera sp.]
MQKDRHGLLIAAKTDAVMAYLQPRATMLSSMGLLGVRHAVGEHLYGGNTYRLSDQ